MMRVFLIFGLFTKHSLFLLDYGMLEGVFENSLKREISNEPAVMIVEPARRFALESSFQTRPKHEAELKVRRIARSLLSHKMPTADVAKHTGLSEEEIKKLYN
ncbi:MAG: hypothetical protein LBS62_08380 [Clostridiales bacterium]|jgi:hypothetical protein|nr:hypothetical protein [Clostridiales bacterium]